jgi:hypothetical protein
MFVVPAVLLANDPPGKTERWGIFEISLQGPADGNPFSDVWLKASFSHGNKMVNVEGFYDGDGTYKIRFMPGETGEWKYKTSSNIGALSGKAGTFTCMPPEAHNHGPVKVSDTYHFKYADSTPYYPFGTTAYAWQHQGKELQQQTLKTLAASPFNKIRMCVFPKRYAYVEDEPELYPFEIQKGNVKPKDSAIAAWDFTRFNPAFFRHLEERLSDLMKLGIEADLIIFHPYDKGHWGFDRMDRETDLRYIRYLVARVGAYRNVWWSLANEYDYMKEKPREAWNVFTQEVVKADPYRHLCSIHNGSEYFDNWNPLFTHVSIQNGSAVEDFGRAILLRDAYRKPVVYDEVCYEGNLPQRWGNLSGEEMVHAFWQGIIAGTYVTHGESYRSPGDTIFWAEGGRFHGSSPPRISFLRKIVEEAPHPLGLPDAWKDHRTSYAGDGYYLVYFGREMYKEWEFSLPKKNGPGAGSKYTAELLDTWNMTVTPLSGIFETGEPEGYRIYDKKRTKIRLPDRAYLAIRLKKVPS